MEVVARILATGEPVNDHEFSGETPLAIGVMRFWNETWYPVRDDTREIVGFGVVVEEITQRKRAEEEREQFNRILERRVAERTAEAEWRANQLQKVAAQMAKIEQRERRRLAQTLHDQLQQLLAAAKVKLGSARHKVRDEPSKEAIAEALSLIDASLEESRSLTKELSPPVLYDGGLAAGLEWLGHETEKQHPTAVLVHADATVEPVDLTTKVFVFQAVRELLLNAVRHAKASLLQVHSSRLDNDRFQVVVEDDGAGFDLDTLGSKQGSQGLGIFSIRELLDVVGGQLEITSTSDQGTRAVITARCRRNPLAVVSAGGASVEPVSTPSGTSACRRRLRVVVADDHPVMRKMLAQSLTEYPHLEIVGLASDGQEAVELALRLRPDLVLMDITMPRMDGIEATRLIKQAAAGISVIGLSMHEGEEMAAAMKHAGASDYLTKTAPLDDLIAAIHALA